jgi:hypothetical protein
MLKVLIVFLGCVKCILPFDGQEQLDEMLYPKSSLSLLRIFARVEKAWRILVLKVSSYLLESLKLGIQSESAVGQSKISVLFAWGVVLCGLALSIIAVIFVCNMIYRRRKGPKEN